MGGSEFRSDWLGRWQPNVPRPPWRDTLRGRTAPALLWRLESLTAPGWRRRSFLRLVVPALIGDLVGTGIALASGMPGRFWWPPLAGYCLGSCLTGLIGSSLLDRWGRPRAMRRIQQRLTLLDLGASAPARSSRRRRVAACGAAIAVVTSVGVLAAVSINVRHSHDRQSEVGEELMAQLIRAHLEPGVPVSTSVRSDTGLPNGIMGGHIGCGVSAVAEIAGHSYDDVAHMVSANNFPSNSLLIQLPEKGGRVRIILDERLDSGWLRFFDLRCLRPPAH